MGLSLLTFWIIVIINVRVTTSDLQSQRAFWFWMAICRYSLIYSVSTTQQGQCFIQVKFKFRDPGAQLEDLVLDLSMAEFG